MDNYRVNPLSLTDQNITTITGLILLRRVLSRKKNVVCLDKPNTMSVYHDFHIKRPLSICLHDI